MKILVATTDVPFVAGGATVIVDSLADALRLEGHEVDTLWIPFHSDWSQIAAQTAGIRFMDVTESSGNRIDLLITVRYPSYALRHPNKVCWFIHHHRPAYDLWGTKYQDIPNDEAGRAARTMMMRSDNTYLGEAKRVFTNSRVVAERLKRFNGIDPAGVLYPPLPVPNEFRPGSSGDYFVYTARLTAIKRQALAIEAMTYVRSPFRLVLIGAADVPSYAGELRSMISQSGLEDRVELRGWVSERDKVALTANAFAVLYIPFNEDSYGYATLEAFHCGKPVITLTDSGGTHEIVNDGVNGLISAPTAPAIAEAMERLWADRRGTREMGRAAWESIEAHHIRWDYVLDRLTS